MKKLVFLIFLLVPFVAHTHGDESKETKIRVLEKVQAGSSTLYLTAREDGHLLGRPFQTELRVSCVEGEELKEAKIQDSHSVCDLDPKSAVINKEKTAIAIKVKEADINAYQKAVENGESKAEVPCDKKTKILKFSLRDFCKKT